MTRILLIEDSPTERRVVTDELETAGWQVVHADDGEKGLVALGQERPDLVLLDIVLPGQNGFQICRQIKRSDDTKNTPVVLISSKDQEADRYWGMKQGADAYLTKPLDMALLVKTIQDLLP